MCIALRRRIFRDLPTMKSSSFAQCSKPMRETAMTGSSALLSLVVTDLPRVDIPKTRHCLKCNAIFTSKWCGERVCTRCKSSKAWKSGALTSQSMRRGR